MHVLIIGNSAAGVSCAKTLRQLRPDVQITIVSDENYPFYSRCLLSYYVAGQISRNSLFLNQKRWYGSNSIKLLTGSRVREANLSDRMVILESKKKLKYDFLVVATGSSPTILPVQGLPTGGVFPLRNIKHADAILRFIRNHSPQHAVVLGAGFIGLKVACALCSCKMKVTVVEKLSQLMPRMLDKKCSNILTRFLNSRGISVKTENSISEVLSRGRNVAAVKLEHGPALPCDILIVAVGVKPNSQILPNDLGRGVITDEFMRTVHKNVFACGDVAITKDIVTGKNTINALWFNAVEQGKIVAHNIAGRPRKYYGSLAANAVDFFNYPIISIGDLTSESENISFSRFSCREHTYKKVVFRENRLVGAILAGDVEAAGVFRSLIGSGVKLNPTAKLLTDIFLPETAEMIIR